MKLLAVLALCIAGASAFCDNAGPIKEAWEHIKHDEVEILYTVFKAYPDIQAKFPKFTGKDLETLKGTADFAIHATRIFRYFTEVIELLGNDANIPAIKTLLNQLGKEHRERGIPAKQFDEFFAALHTYLPTHVKWNDNVEAAWLCDEREVRKILNSALEGHPVE